MQAYKQRIVDSNHRGLQSTLRRRGVEVLPGTARVADPTTLEVDTADGPRRLSRPLYDEGSLERLAFISRATQLGCSLEEITDLVTAWEGEHGAPLQQLLQNLMAATIAASQGRVAELRALSEQPAAGRRRAPGPHPRRARRPRLRLRHATLSAAAPPPILTLGVPSGPTTVALTTKAAAPTEPPIACTLTDTELLTRIEDWQAVMASATRREPLEGCVRVVIGADTPVAALAELVTAEQACCMILGFALTVDTRGVAREVTAPVDALGTVQCAGEVVGVQVRVEDAGDAPPGRGRGSLVDLDISRGIDHEVTLAYRCRPHCWTTCTCGSGSARSRSACRPVPSWAAPTAPAAPRSTGPAPSCASAWQPVAAGPPRRRRRRRWTRPTPAKAACSRAERYLAGPRPVRHRTVLSHSRRPGDRDYRPAEPPVRSTAPSASSRARLRSTPQR